MRFVTWLFLITLAASLFSNQTYVSPYQFRKLSDFVLLNKQGVNLDFDPKQVFEGAVVYVYPKMLNRFFASYHPQIPARYILFTHGGDAPSPREFAHYLNDPKIIAWFGRNPTIQGHEKFIPVPIGVALRLNNDEKYLAGLNRVLSLPLEKEFLLYLNITIRNFPSERRKVHNLFYNKEYAFSCGIKPLDGYLADLKKSKFVLSPRGRGLDCYRTWETILMGSIPIVKSSDLDPLYTDLPVLIVNDWEEINESFLAAKYEEMSKKTYNLEKLYIDYWKNEINKVLMNAGISRKY